MDFSVVDWKLFLKLRALYSEVFKLINAVEGFRERQKESASLTVENETRSKQKRLTGSGVSICLTPEISWAKVRVKIEYIEYQGMNVFQRFGKERTTKFEIVFWMTLGNNHVCVG